MSQQDFSVRETKATTPNQAPAAKAAEEASRNWWSARQRFFTLSEGNQFLLLAIVIGLLSGLTVVCFRLAIEWIRLALLGSAPAPSAMRVLLVPAGAGLVVAFLVQRFFRAARSSGVNETKAAVYVFDGYVPFRTVIGTFVTCSLAIGSGQSLGPEDPSLQMGAGIASTLGRRLKLSREKLRLLAPVGAAAGLAAAFNAPISAMSFVIEEVLGTWSAGALGAIVLAAVSSAVVMRSFRRRADVPRSCVHSGASRRIAIVCGVRRRGRISVRGIHAKSSPISGQGCGRCRNGRITCSPLPRVC